MSQIVIIPKGSLFTVTTGAYSDYCVSGVFRAVEDIDTEILLLDWLNKHPEQKEKYKFRESDFLASLTHYLEPVDCFEMHLGDYGKASTVSVSNLDNDY